MYSWLHWRELQRAHPGAQINGEIAESSSRWPTAEQFEQAAAATPRIHFETLLSQLEYSRAAYEELAKVVSEKFVSHMPSLRELREAIDEVIQLVGMIIKNKHDQEPDPPVILPSTEAETTQVVQPFDHTQTGHNTQTFAQPHDRPQALQYLRAVTAYFHQAEPQNPANCLLDRAWRWLHLPFAQLLPEIVRDEAALADSQDRLGLKGTTEE